MNYEIKESDEIICDEGKRYAVKALWEKTGDHGSCRTRVVVEGAEDRGGGWYAAEQVEVFRKADGSYEIIGHWPEEETDEGGGITGVWGWNDKEGVRFFSMSEVVGEHSDDPSSREHPVWFNVVG